MYTLAAFLRQISLARNLGETAAVSDGELLRRFQAHADEAAFELLVWRHGPMVLGVCRRVLRDVHAAEDAFQATFLTLARKAGSIGTREAVAGWLYTVAHRIALAARARQVRQAAVERPADETAPDGPGYLPPDGPAERELRELLRAEVDRLPDPFRAVIVLCCLEGRTHAEAAELLGVPQGTVESRLVRARERLRLGLVARGVALAVAPFAAFLSEHSLDLVKVSPALVHGTVHLVLLMKMGALAAVGETAELANGAGQASGAVLRLTVAAAVVAVATLGSGAALVFPGSAPEPAPTVPLLVPTDKPFAPTTLPCARHPSP